MARRFTKVQARREKLAVNAGTRRNKDAAKLEQFLEDRKKKAKIGDAGFEFHSGWPMPGEKNYRKNVMQDATLAAFEKELERKDMSLEDYMKQKPEMREMDRCGHSQPAQSHCCRATARKETESILSGIVVSVGLTTSVIVHQRCLGRLISRHSHGSASVCKPSRTKLIRAKFSTKVMAFRLPVAHCETDSIISASIIRVEIIGPPLRAPIIGRCMALWCALIAAAKGAASCAAERHFSFGHTAHHH